jgi:hypothetical protein
MYMLAESVNYICERYGKTENAKTENVKAERTRANVMKIPATIPRPIAKQTPMSKPETRRKTRTG